jgi:hypothetical protein
MTWNYRVVKKQSDDEPYFQIYEVYYKGKGISLKNIAYMSQTPIAPFGSNKKELKRDLKWMQRAFDLPVINYEKLCKKKGWNPASPDFNTQG